MAIGEGAGIAVSVEPCAVGAVRAVAPLLAIGGEGHNGEFRRVELRLANTNELQKLCFVDHYLIGLTEPVAPRHGRGYPQRSHEVAHARHHRVRVGIGVDDAIEIRHTLGEPLVQGRHLAIKRLALDGPTRHIALHGTPLEFLHIAFTFAPRLRHNAVGQSVPLRLVVGNKRLATKEVGEEGRYVAVVAIAPQGVGAHHQLAVVGIIVVACGHGGPVEVVARVEIP